MAQELQLALIQSSLVWEDPEQNRLIFSKKISGISSDVDLIILPEMFTTGFTMTPEKLNKKDGELTLIWMQEKAKEMNAAVVGSISFYENGSHTNRLFFVKPEGDYEQYDKRHTFTLAGEDKVFNAGKERLIVNFRGFKICPLICYDLRFPVWARNTEKYDALLYVANWPKPRISAWDALLKARAIENMSYAIGVNRIGIDDLGHEYSGHSGVYDALGEQIAFSETEAVIYTTISKEHISSLRENLKFLDDSDEFTLKL